eukprot:snap_masked-scaffold577_size191314-processed-gene-0.29 protein:Tk12280 transcript:snap_masked-scaffold577_size191314-processed-gene-0.29-mRNA-1 annotation:"AGAP000946-PA"
MAIGGLLQSGWDHICSHLGESYLFYHVGGSIVLVNGIFFLFGGLFVLMDLTGRPSFVQKYKIQPNARPAWNREKMWTLMRTVLLNQFVIGSAFMLASGHLHLYLHGHPPDLSRLPALFEVVFQLIVFTLVEELLFFYSHWFLHHRSIYKFVHKQHHEWTAPIAYEAVYAHPVEHLMSNLIPASVGPLLCNAHVLTTLAFFALITFVTVCHHSGYHLPLMPSPQAHDYHHMQFNQNYGALGILDWLHGTDQEFRKSIAYHRHHTLWTWESASQLHPELKKQS